LSCQYETSSSGKLITIDRLLSKHRTVAQEGRSSARKSSAGIKTLLEARSRTALPPKVSDSAQHRQNKSAILGISGIASKFDQRKT
jgi:hypothetical protein